MIHHSGDLLHDGNRRNRDDHQSRDAQQFHDDHQSRDGHNRDVHLSRCELHGVLHDAHDVFYAFLPYFQPQQHLSMAMAVA